MSIFSLKKANGHWWEGSLTINYNLRTIAMLLLCVVVIPFVVIYVVGKYLWKGMCWVAPFIWAGLCWVGAQITRFWRWLCGLFKREPKAETPTEEKPRRNWWWLVPVILAILAALLCLNKCDGDDKGSAVVIEQQEKAEQVVVYDNAFDKVVVARAYLDGVQEKVTKTCPRALVGFKFIDDKPVADYNFTGKTYEEALKVVADSWKPLVLDNVTVKLTEDQMATVTLVAMRMGKYGFTRSTFLKKVNEGKFEEATDWLLLQDADGNIRKTGDEPKQYFYVLRMLWTGRLSYDELLDMPMFSYKGCDVNLMYDKNGKHEWHYAIDKQMNQGAYPTVRKALGL